MGRSTLEGLVAGKQERAVLSLNLSLLSPFLASLLSPFLALLLSPFRGENSHSFPDFTLLNCEVYSLRIGTYEVCMRCV